MGVLREARGRGFKPRGRKGRGVTVNMEATKKSSICSAVPSHSRCLQNTSFLKPERFVKRKCVPLGFF